MFDVNQDGNLTAAEVATGLLLLAMGSHGERLQLAFDLFDVSGDGMLMAQVRILQFNSDLIRI